MSQGIDRAWVSRPLAAATAGSVVHIVERLAPGGIETLVLDLVAHGGGDLIFSLQGSRDELLGQWPALQAMPDRFEGFQRKPGVDYRLVPRLARALWKAKAKTVFLHHMGPLLYGGLAAKLARVPRLILVEHDAWHYENRRERLL